MFTLVGPPSAYAANTDTERIESPTKLSRPPSDTFETWMLLGIDGDAEAQFNLGLLYSEGKSVPVDYKQAAYWYKKAAQQGHTGAQYKLAHLFLDGRGVDKDSPEAVYWWQQAAQRGHVLAQQYLGYAYYKGIGTTKDMLQAMRWFREAAKGGDPRAKIMLATIENESTQATNPAEEKTVSVHTKPVSEPNSELLNTQQKTTSAHRTVDTGNSAVPTPFPRSNAGESNVASNDLTLTRPEQENQQVATKISKQPNDSVVAAVKELEDVNKPTETIRQDEPLAIDTNRGPSKTHNEVETTHPENILTNISTDKISQSTIQESVDEQVKKSGPQPQNQASAGQPTSQKPSGPGGSKPSLPEVKTATASIQEKLIVTPSLSQSLGTENDRWLFGQPANFYTLQLISAPNQGTISNFIREAQIDTGKILQTRLRGERWWYLLFGSFPSIEASKTAASELKVAQERIWIRRFGALQENRCKNSGDITGLTEFCKSLSLRAGTAPTDSPPQIDSEDPNSREPAPLSASEIPQHAAIQESPAASKTGEASIELNVVASVPPAPKETLSTREDLRHDENDWLFSQPSDYYTVQLISVPEISQVTRFFQKHQLYDEAIYFTTRREDRNWFIAIYGSHPNLDAAKQATKALPFSSGSVWIRQFAAIQKNQCRVANQLPEEIAGSLNYYCKP